MRRPRSRRIVVDADIAQAAGTVTDAGRSRACREFLGALRDICHRAVMTRELLDEWKRHRSSFSSAWLTSMYARRKVIVLSAGGNPQIDGDEDAHLLRAAISTDRLVASMDERARARFARLVRDLPAVGLVVWVNPELSEEDPIHWLTSGARADKPRQLARRGA